MSSAKWRPFCLGLNVLMSMQQVIASSGHSLGGYCMCKCNEMIMHLLVPYKLCILHISSRDALTPFWNWIHAERTLPYKVCNWIDAEWTLPHDDVIKLKQYPRYWPCVRGNHRSQVDSPHKGPVTRALVFSLVLVWTNGQTNRRVAGDLRGHGAHSAVTVMRTKCLVSVMEDIVTNNIDELKSYAFPCISILIHNIMTWITG